MGLKKILPLVLIRKIENYNSNKMKEKMVSSLHIIIKELELLQRSCQSQVLPRVDCIKSKLFMRKETR
jgi:hypothetical protein